MLDYAFLFFAIVGGGVMVVQFALMLMGIGDDGGDFDVEAGDAGFDAGDVELDGDHPTSLAEAADADFDPGSSMRLFQIVSLRGVIAALAFFGLGGMAARSAEMEPTPSLLIALAAGFAGLYGVYWVMKQMYKLRSSGNANIRNALGRSASVYVPIPAAGEGRGKVHLTFQGRSMEYEAVTEENEKIATGEAVVVIGLAGADVLQVARAAKDAAAETTAGATA